MIIVSRFFLCEFRGEKNFFRKLEKINKVK